MKAIDQINRRFPRAVSIAATGFDKSWKPKAERISKRYTTDWLELAGFGKLWAAPDRVMQSLTRLQPFPLETTAHSEESITNLKTTPPKFQASPPSPPEKFNFHHRTPEITQYGHAIPLELATESKTGIQALYNRLKVVGEVECWLKKI